MATETDMQTKIRRMSEWEEVTHQRERKLDWTHFLDASSVEHLRHILMDAYKHREAYFRATDIKNAQLWAALLEMHKKIEELTEQVDKMKPKQTLREFVQDKPDEKEVLSRIRSSMQKRPEDSPEATNALINSLMRF
jgi:hypothetical protein